MKTVNIATYGISPNMCKDCTVPLQKALAQIKEDEEETVLEFPSGEYHFYKEHATLKNYHTSNTDTLDYPEKIIGILLEGQNNLTINGNGSMFIFHGNMMALAIVDSKNIKLENFSWDYPSAPTGEMVIEEVDKRRVVYRIPQNQKFELVDNQLIWFEDSPLSEERYWQFSNDELACNVMVYEPDMPRIARHNLDESPFFGTKQIKIISEQLVEITYEQDIPSFYQKDIRFEITRNEYRETAGAFIWQSENVSISSVFVHYLYGFGWLSQMSKGISFDNCYFGPRKDSDRMTASFADFIHVSGGAGLVKVENCHFAHAHDDAINIHGSFMKVVQVIDEHTVRLRYEHRQQGGFPQFYTGNQVAFYRDDNLAQVGTKYTVKTAIFMSDEKEMDITFEENVADELGEEMQFGLAYVAENMTYVPAVIIRRNHFELIPTRGILCTTSKPVVISENTFRHITMSSIYLSGDSKEWYESGKIGNMFIYKNDFGVGSSKYDILAEPITSITQESEQIIHENIFIIGNQFTKDMKEAISMNRSNYSIDVCDEKKQEHMRLWYQTPAKHDYEGWETQSIPLGNGDLGCNIFGGVECEYIQLNEKSLWSGTTLGVDGNTNGNGKLDFGYSLRRIQTLLGEGKVDEATEAMEHLQGDEIGLGAYQDFGEMEILFPELSDKNTSAYRRELDIETAIASVEFRQDSKSYKREYFASYPENVIVGKLSGEQMHCRLQIIPKQRIISLEQNENMIWLTGQTGELSESQHFAAAIYCDTDGNVSSEDGFITISKAENITFYMSIQTDYDRVYPLYRTTEDIVKKVKDRVTRACEKGYEIIKAEHIADYKSLYERVELSLGTQCRAMLPTDKLLEMHKAGIDETYLPVLLYQYGRYLLIAASREGGLPANLQGVWNASNQPMWQSDYHLNINLQMNYWGAHTANLAECVTPLVDYVNESLVIPGRVTAYHCTGIGTGDVKKADGWLVHTQNNIFGHTGPGSAWRWGWDPSAGGFIMQNVYEHYRFTRDIHYLNEHIYPALEEASKMWSQLLIWDEQGRRLVVSPCFSPEHGPVSMGATFDQQMIWQLFNDTIEAANELVKQGFETVVDLVIIEEIKRQIVLLKPYKIGNWGQILEWQEEDSWVNRGFDDKQVTPNHRHISHLLGVYPEFNSCFKEEQYQKAAKISLIDRKDEVEDDYIPSWSKALKICIWARLLNAEKCVWYVKKMIEDNILPNLWSVHPPFQIDGNYGYTAGINEMLIQSHDEQIHILPALPKEWQSDGFFTGLVARGNVVVDCRWENGKIQKLVVTARSDVTCVVVWEETKKCIDLTSGEVKKLV